MTTPMSPVAAGQAPATGPRSRRLQRANHDARGQPFADALRRVGVLGGWGAEPGDGPLGGGRKSAHEAPREPVLRGHREGRGARGPDVRADGDPPDVDPEQEPAPPFSPPVAALLPPPSVCVASGVESTPVARSLAEVAAIADRLVTSMSVGRVGQQRHELRMTLDLGAGRGLGVGISLRGEELEVHLDAENECTADLSRIAEALEAEVGAEVTLAS